MAFPTSPSNNQVHRESGSNRTYVYDSTLGVWDQVKEAQSDISNIAGHISNEVTGFAGIKNCDTWRMHTTFLVGTSATTLNKNWERADTRGATHIGQGMSERNGVFQFPATGVWLCSGGFMIHAYGGSRESANAFAQVTENDESSWANATYTSSSMAAADHKQCSFWLYVFGVTNITTHKLRIQVYGSGNINFYGDSSENKTYVMFQRIGDV